MGDVHGQFYDVKEIFRLGGNPEQSKFLFLGDYVDRGSYGVEIVVTLFSLKICFPNAVFLLRGNHECRQMTSYHNFREECIQKYDQEVYELVMEAFDCLPVAAVVNGHFLAVHGGISPEIKNVLDLNRLERVKEPPQMGALCDFLWADPVDNETGLQQVDWMPNGSRGCSYYFGWAQQVHGGQLVPEGQRADHGHPGARGPVRGLQGLPVAEQRLPAGDHAVLGAQLLRLLRQQGRGHQAVRELSRTTSCRCCSTTSRPSRTC